MYYEENCMTYTEDEAGCCDAIVFKFRKKRHFIMISLLLISAIASVVAGMYNGITLKKYSDVAILVGIFLPSIILVFICVYLAFICGRESFRSSVMSRIRHLSGHSRNSRDVLQSPQTNSVTLRERRVSYQSKTADKSIIDKQATGVENLPPNKTGKTADNSVDYYDAKIFRKHFRSFSNSDIPKLMHRSRRCDVLHKKTKTYKTGCATPDDNQYSSRFREYKDLNQHKKFKRSVSDTANKNKYVTSKEDEFVWNTQSLDKLRRHVIKANTLEDATGKTDCDSYNVLRKPLNAWKNYKNTEKCDKLTRFEEYGGYGQRYKIRQEEYANVNLPEDFQTKTRYTKSEIHLYPSNILKPSYECKQAVHFSSFQPGGDDIEDIGEIASCSSSGGEKSSSLSSSDILEMKRKSNRLGNFPSAQDAYRSKRKTIYFPSTNHKESAQSSREYAHKYCRYLKKEKKWHKSLVEEMKL